MFEGQIESQIELILMVRALHIFAELIEGLVVLFMVEVGKLVHDDHAQELLGELPKEYGDAYLVLAFKPPALNARDVVVRSKGVIDDVYLVVVDRLCKRRGIFHIVVFELVHIAKERFVALVGVFKSVLASKILFKSPLFQKPQHLILYMFWVVADVSESLH